MSARNERSLREETLPQRRKKPSFSSSLLDVIYQSIAQEEGQTTMMQKQGSSSSKREKFNSLREFQNGSSLGRAIMIEKWIERQNTQSHSSMHKNYSTSSSSESSSSACMFSSSEESYKGKSKSTNCKHFEQQKQKPKNEGSGFTKTKLRALKIYGELKKVKQPISPGGRISSFLNSIFNSSNAKKAKMCYVGAVEDVSLERKSKSTCSSASSFSRSCLRKTPRGKMSGSNGAKRSVRFYPESVIVDEDCRPCGHKCIYDKDPSLMPSLNVQKIVKSSSLREELQNYVREKQSCLKNKSSSEFEFRGFLKNTAGNEAEEDYDDDADSYASSDLFELDSIIGVGKYREELPVYETTNLKTNQAIANGLIS